MVKIKTLIVKLLLLLPMKIDGRSTEKFFLVVGTESLNYTTSTTWVVVIIFLDAKDLTHGS